MPKCTVCHHLQHLEIDQALLSGDFTLAALSQKFGPSPSALQRHKDHLKDKMLQSRRRLQEIREQGSLLLLNAFLDHVKRGVEAAEAEGNLTGVFRGSYIGSRIIYQLNRMEGSMQLDTLHRLLASPAWVPQGSLLPTDPKLITDLHQALIENASLFCPEPPHEIFDDDAHEDEDWGESEDDEDATDDPVEADDLDLAAPLLETRNSELGTQLATLRQLQKLLPDLDLTLADLPLRTEIAPKNQRKISEKSAPKTLRCTQKSKQNHKDTPGEKKLAKNRQNEAIAAVTNAFTIPTPETENRKLQTVFSAPAAVPDTASPPANAAGIEGENELSAAVPETTPPTDSQVLDLSQEVLNEAQAAELIAYLKDFPPYTRPADNPKYDPPSAPTSHVAKTANPEPETVFSPTPGPCSAEPAPPVSEEPPGLYSRTGDELFLMTHGYPKDNPPKHIPNRRLDDDLQGFSLFREIKKFF